MSESMNLAGRAARWSAAHWKRATFGWLLFAAAAIVLGTAVGTKSISQANQATGESKQAERILASAGFKRPATESVLIQSKTLTTKDQSFQSLIARVTQTVSLNKNVTNVQTDLNYHRKEI